MRNFTVAAYNSTYFFNLREISPNVYEGIGGFGYELLLILSRALNFHFNILVPDKNAFAKGNKREVIIGILEKQQADMFIEMTPVSYPRSKVVDFAFPHVFDGISFVSMKAGLKQNDFKILNPFQTSVWIGVVLALLTCSLLFSLLQYSRKRKSPGMAKYLCSFVSALEVITGNQKIQKVASRRSTKMLFGFSGLPMRVLTFCFLSVFLSILVTPSMNPQIKTVEELAKASRNHEVRVTTLAAPTLTHLLTDKSSTQAQDLGTYLRQHPEDLITLGRSAINMILDGFVYIGHRQISKLVAFSKGVNKKLFFSDDNLELEIMAVAFRKGFCCVQDFDKMIIRLHQAGVLTKLFDDYLYRTSSRESAKDDPEQSKQGPRAISFSDLSVIFWLTLICYAFATGILIIEIFWKKVSNHA